MDFIDEIKQYCKRVDSLKDNLSTEEATLMDNAGANKLCIKRIMGHTSNDITDKVYTHKDIEELRKAVSLLA